MPALAIATLVLLPFVGKAFTIDDTFFLMSARHASADPLHPTAFVMTWGGPPDRASRIAPTGPLMAWLLVPAVRLGGSETVAHVVVLAFLLLGILATVSLALRCGLPGPWAAAAGVFVAATPAVLGMASTAMPDVPAMALGVAGLERLVAWRDERACRDAALASLLLGLAPLARTHLLCLLPVGALLLVEGPWRLASWTRVPARVWLPLACAPMVAVALTWLTADPDQGSASVLTAAVRLSSASRVTTNAAAFLAHWVLALPFAIPWALARWRSLISPPWALAGGTVVAAALIRMAHGAGAPYALAPLMGLGAACLLDVFVDAARRRDSLQIALGAWLLAPVPALAYSHLPSKYLVAAAPAAAILVVRALAVSGATERRLSLGTLVAGLALGIAILRADAALAEVGRTAARELIAPYTAAGRRVWYLGHWGFQWYAERAGAIAMSPEPPYPVTGDLIAFHDNPVEGLPRRALEGFPLVRRIEDHAPGGRIMSMAAGAGFYSNGWGYLPWAWGDGVIDAVDLWIAGPP